MKLYTGILTEKDIETLELLRQLKIAGGYSSKLEALNAVIKWKENKEK